MPYIQTKDRARIEQDDILVELVGRLETCGELNYTITRILHECVKNWGESYETYDKLIGAIECLKLELYRRKITPYEDTKIEKNGDV